MREKAILFVFFPLNLSPPCVCVCATCLKTRGHHRHSHHLSTLYSRYDWIATPLTLRNLQLTLSSILEPSRSLPAKDLAEDLELNPVRDNPPVLAGRILECRQSVWLI